jgi:hypothetical protein
LRLKLSITPPEKSWGFSFFLKIFFPAATISPEVNLVIKEEEEKKRKKKKKGKRKRKKDLRSAAFGVGTGILISVTKFFVKQFLSFTQGPVCIFITRPRGKS